jgi:hypothetical protein
VNASRIYFIFPALRRETISLAEGCGDPEIYDTISAKELVSLYFIKVEKCVSVGCHGVPTTLLRHDEGTGNSSLYITPDPVKLIFRNNDYRTVM